MKQTTHAIYNEVEVTAVVDKKKFEEIKAFCTKNLTHTKTQTRFMIRFFKDKVDVREPLDIRYKWTSGVHQIVVKKGAQGSQSRQEITMNLENSSQLDQFIAFVSLLGYKVGDAMYRETERFQNKEVEVALVVGDPYFCIEIESLDAKTKKAAVAQVHAFCQIAGLTPLNKSEYQAFLRKVDKNANLIFDLKDTATSFKKNSKWEQILKQTVDS